MAGSAGVWAYIKQDQEPSFTGCTVEVSVLPDNSLSIQNKATLLFYFVDS